MNSDERIIENGERWAFGLFLLTIAAIVSSFLRETMAVLLFLLAVATIYACFYLIHYVLSLPFRRRERARIFLELLEASVEHGRGVEQSIIRLSHSKERSLGTRFHLLAALLEQGLPLLAALEKVPRLLPPAVMAMLRVGAETGDVRRVLPSCRAHLRDAAPRVQKAQNYLIAMFAAILPAQLFIYCLVRVVVLPKFTEIFRDMFGEQVMPSTAFIAVLDTAWPVLMALVGLPVLAGVLLYVLGPRPAYWLEWLAPNFHALIARPLNALARLADRAVLLIPWQRRRRERDFSSMLALLLDAGVPEEKAVLFAGESTANRAFIARTVRVVEELRRGVKLPDALLFMDDAGELRWRMANAARSAGHFRESLAGWHDALDARAFGQEQAVAHIVTSACVMINGLLVGVLLVGIFQFLVQLIDHAASW